MSRKIIPFRRHEYLDKPPRNKAYAEGAFGICLVGFLAALCIRVLVALFN